MSQIHVIQGISFARETFIASYVPAWIAAYDVLCWTGQRPGKPTADQVGAVALQSAMAAWDTFVAKTRP